MTLFTAQLHPGQALGFLFLGASLHDCLTRLKAEPQRFPKLDLTYSPANPVQDPVLLTLPANGIRLRFDGPEQRLRLIEVLDFSKNHIFFREQNKDRALVKPPSASDDVGGGGGGSSDAPTGPTFRHIYSRFLGPTYEGEFVPGDDAAGVDGTYVLSYPGVAFTFPMDAAAYVPDKDVVSLLSTPSNRTASSMAIFSGDSWAQARDALWDEVLPSIKTSAALAKSRDAAPDEISLVQIHGGGKLQLFRGWDSTAAQVAPSSAAANAAATVSTATLAATASTADTTATAASAASAAGRQPSSSSFWIALGETTPQELVAELGPPDAIYRKNDQRMYIHKIRTASNSRTRTNGGPGGFGGFGTGSDARHNHRRQDDTLTDTDQSSIPTASSDDDDDEAVDDELLTGNVSGECFFNYFHLGFDLLVSTPTSPSRPPPSRSGGATEDRNGHGDATQDADGNLPPDRALRTEAPDRLVATKMVLHGNVPGSYPFNRHRRCRWAIAYVGDKTAAVNAETPFPQIEERLQAEWASIYPAGDEPRPRQRGMVLNRGWGDSPGSSIELLGGWEEGQRGGGGAGSTGGGVTGGSGAGPTGPGGQGAQGGAGSVLRGVKATEDSTTTLYGFPGLVFEVLRNGFVSALTVF